MLSLYEHQLDALERIRSGSILHGGVGSGKSRTALAYYYLKECDGELCINGFGDDMPMRRPKDLYIITTAKKRDSLEWEHEAIPFGVTKNETDNVNGVKLVVDSWNNIQKYVGITDSFFIFDEQRVVGRGAWSKSFLKITAANRWILLSATPGDTWSDYIPVFIANGFYKNRTEFIKRHVVYSRFTKYPKVDKYVDTGRLLKLKRDILIDMDYDKHTISHHEDVKVVYDKETYDYAVKQRWDIYRNEPVRDISGLCYLMRRIVNSDEHRLVRIREIMSKHPKVIIFYNFDYELEILRTYAEDSCIAYSEWNGHKHESIPDGDQWIYLCQYTSACEGWNCIETNAIIFYSQNYSYKVTAQAAGRIDRMNTPYTDLYYYHIRSTASIDLAIYKALSRKKKFNEKSLPYFKREENKESSRETGGASASVGC